MRTENPFRFHCKSNVLMNLTVLCIPLKMAYSKLGRYLGIVPRAAISTVDTVLG